MSMTKPNKFGLSNTDIDRIINELIQDQNITSAIEKIVVRRLNKNPHGTKAWKQSVVDKTVTEILQKLRIVDMIMEEQQIIGYNDDYRPSFSESEPQQHSPSQLHPRRRARQLNKKAALNNAFSNNREHRKEEFSKSADIGDINLDSTQVLTVTLPSAVKEMPHPPLSTDSKHSHASFITNRSESSESLEKRSPNNDPSDNPALLDDDFIDHIHDGRGYLPSPLGNEHEEEEVQLDHANEVGMNIIEERDSPGIDIRYVEESMNNDSVEYDHSSNASVAVSDSSSSNNTGDRRETHGNAFENDTEWVADEEENSLIIQQEQDLEQASTGTRDSLDGMLEPVEMSGEGVIITPSSLSEEGGVTSEETTLVHVPCATGMVSGENISGNDRDSGDRDFSGAAGEVHNASAISEEQQYAEDDWEEPPVESSRGVCFADPLVSDLFLSRHKYDRDEVASMFYTADEGNKFQMDFDRELERSMDVDKGWLDWMMERTEEEAAQHEKEDAEFQSYEYELEEEYEPAEEYF